MLYQTKKGIFTFMQPEKVILFRKYGTDYKEKQLIITTYHLKPNKAPKYVLEGYFPNEKDILIFKFTKGIERVIQINMIIDNIILYEEKSVIKEDSE